MTAGFLKWTYICIGWLRRAHRPGGVGLVNKVHHLWGERREARPSHSDRDCHKCTKEGQRTHSASQVTATLLYTPRLQYKYFTSEKGEAAVVHGFLQYLWYNLTAGSCFYFQKHWNYSYNRILYKIVKVYLFISSYLWPFQSIHEEQKLSMWTLWTWYRFDLWRQP